MRTVASLVVGSLFVLASCAQAHEVVWLENPTGAQPSKPMVLVYGKAPHQIVVKPEFGELCIVQVNLDPPGSNPLVTARVTSDNPGVTVEIDVTAVRLPAGNFESMTISGEWHATGQPPNKDCNAITPNRFSVKVNVGSVTMAQQTNAVAVSDPVSTATGEVTAFAVDLSLGGPFPLQFTRSYASQLSAGGVASALGANWVHSYDASLQILGTTASATLYPGKTVQFEQVGGIWQLSDPDPMNYQLSASGGGYQLASPVRGLIYTFDGSGKLASVADRNGNTHTVTQGVFGPVTVADGLGRTLTFTYSGALLSAVKDQTGRTVTFAHAGTNLTSVTDANGKTTTYGYTSSSQPSLLSSTQRPAGNTTWSQQFDSASRVVKQLDSKGNPTTLVFDQPAAGENIVTDPAGGVSQYVYDDAGDLVEHVDANAKSQLLEYDNASRLVRVIDRLGNQTLIGYDPASGYVSSVTDPEGHATTYNYTQRTQGASKVYDLSGVQFADGAAVSLAYDAQGNRVGVTNEVGKQSTATYDARGQMLTSANPAGGVTTSTYNGDGTLASLGGPVGTISFAYDTRKRVSGATFGDGTSRAYAYDAMDRLVSATDERGNVRSFAFDANGNLASVTDPFNRTATFAYDTDDLAASVTDPSGKTATFHYDALGALTSSTNAAGETFSFKYDALRRLTSIADPSGKGASFAYDAQGNLAAVTDALGNMRTFVVDKVGRPVRMTTPLNESFSRTLDAMGRLASLTDPLARTTNFSYEPRGLLSKVSAPGGVAATFARDDLGMLSGITDPNGKVWTRSHDKFGRPLSLTDPLGHEISYAYDARGRIKSITSPEGTVTITRDPTGKATQRQYSDGTSKTLAYDANNRPTGGTGLALSYDVNGRLATSNGLAIARDGVGRITSVTYAPGKSVAYAYDARGLLASVTDWAGGSATFAYDAAARVVGIARANGVGTQIVYDANGRVSGIDESRGAASLASIAVQRDGLGRVVTATRNLSQQPALVPGTRVQSVDAASQLTGRVYDSLGRIKQDPQRTYTWNLASELTAYASPAATATFVYDAMGMRTSRQPGVGAGESFVLNYATGLPSVAIVKATGVDSRYYVYLPDGSLLYAIDAGTNAHHYYHFDEVGSTVLLTGDAGTATDSYGITPYGETVTVSGSTPNPFTWLGRWGVMQEGSTGLYYMRARYYDSATARFLSRDPVLQMDPRAVNPYQYASGDPLSIVDPMGLKGMDVAGGCSGAYSADVGSILRFAGGLIWSPYAKQFEQLAWDLGAKNLNRYEHAVEWAATHWAFRGMHVKRWRDAIQSGRTWLNFDEWFVGRVLSDLAEEEQAAVAKLTQLTSKAAGYASTIRNAGNMLMVVGGAIQVGCAVIEDVHNGAGVIVTATDVAATSGTVLALAAAPALAVTDLATGGLVSTGLHNAMMFPNTAARVAFGRTTSRDADAIKATFTRPTGWFNWGQSLWSAGEDADEYYGISDYLYYIVR